MRKNLFALALAAVSMLGAAAQKTIEGNGKLVTREVAVTAFTELKAGGVYELHLAQGSKETVKIEADENLQEMFEVKNDGSKLVVSMKKAMNTNIKSKNKLRVYVTFKEIKALELSTVGNVKADEQLRFADLDLKTTSVGNVYLKLSANKLNIKNTAVGNITLSGKAEHAVIKSSGVGNFDAGNLVVSTIEINNTGVGNAEVNATKEVKVKDNMVGKVKNKGAGTVRREGKVHI